MENIWALFKQLNDLLESEHDFKAWQEIHVRAAEFYSSISNRYKTEQLALVGNIDFLKNADQTQPLSFGQCGDDVYWKIIDNILYIGGSGPMWNFRYDKDDEMVSVPWVTLPDNIVILDGVTSIGELAFAGSSISNIIIPSSIKSIEQLAFFDAQIDKLLLPETIETIEEGIVTGTRCVVDTLIVSANIPNINPMAFFSRAGVLAKTIVLIGELPKNLTPLIDSCIFDYPDDCTIYYPKEWDTPKHSFYSCIFQEISESNEDFLKQLKKSLFPKEMP